MEKKLGKQYSKIPSYSLQHKNEVVSFAIRSMKEVVDAIGTLKDAPHSHEYYTVIWSQNYSGKHFIDYKEYNMKPNDVFFVSPGQVHQVEHLPDPKGYVILFSCDFLQKNYVSEDFIYNLNLFSDVGNTPPISVSADSAFRLSGLVYEIENTYKQDDPFKYDKIGAYLKLFLIECNQYAHHPTTHDHTQILQTGGHILSKFKHLLDEHYTNWHKVSDYAQELNITSDYLNNVVKSTIGRNVKELIQSRIVLEAKRLGLHTEWSNKEIAYQIGFNDPSHFSRFFKKAEGIPFSNFRKKLNKELTA